MGIRNSLMSSAYDVALTPESRAERNSGRVTSDGKTPGCVKQIWVTVFFDGTNNNQERDQKKIADSNKRSHSNVVVLHDACKLDPEDGYYRYYIPGVGTAFPEIGEPTESDAGKAYGWGGESRIYWGMVMVLNSMLRSVTNNKKMKVEPAKAGKDVKSLPLYKVDETAANYLGIAQYFGPLVTQLKAELKSISRPVLTQVNLSVFGFSRGAAQARVFCTFMDKLCENDGTLAGIKLNLQFLGIFDTVASVGVADAAPGFNGFGGYANGTLDVPARVKRCVHYVAAHEMRKAFPLSSVRIAKTNAYPSNCHEVVYPGSHSDVGGGYAPGSQGKGVQRSELLSQVPLRHMYAEARKYGVPLLETAELRAKGLNETAADLEIHPGLINIYNAYLRSLQFSGHTVETMLRTHLDAYRHWRMVACDGPKKYGELSSVRIASAQDREDMHSSEQEFQVEARRAMLKDQETRSVAEHNLWLLHTYAPKPSLEVSLFFDLYLHDSHASFYMTGPVTDEDRKNAIEEARKKLVQAHGNASALNPFERALLAPGVSVQNFPLMTDFDTQAIGNAKGLLEGGLAVITRTRRESGPFIRYRVVFDDSRSIVDKPFAEADHHRQTAMA